RPGSSECPTVLPRYPEKGIAASRAKRKLNRYSASHILPLRNTAFQPSMYALMAFIVYYSYQHTQTLHGVLHPQQELEGVFPNPRLLRLQCQAVVDEVLVQVNLSPGVYFGGDGTGLAFIGKFFAAPLPIPMLGYGLAIL